MASAKDGRLFTEPDVRRIVRHAIFLHKGVLPREAEAADTTAVVLDFLDGMHEAKPGEHEALTFPPDEPLFLLRGQDKAAPEAIARYGAVARYAGAPRELVEASGKASMEMVDWQRDHPDRVKAPG